MRIDIISAVPELLNSPFEHSILKRAQTKKIVTVKIHNIRDYVNDDPHRVIDDYAFGGGAGMVLMIEPIARCIEKLKSECVYDEIIYMTPDGELFDQKIANQTSLLKNIIILCGHYKGVDQRVRDYFITKEISIGNFVLSGGELAANVFCDAVIRLIPGVLNDETSALTDSFQDNLLAPPVYTRPEKWRDLSVPEVLTSGNHKKIDEWRMEQSYEITLKKRPDLLK
ncbi:MAG: tRNA (guanosine(37)-N1)-methyltransferase TrmD [Bacteroidia bacterium]|nr:tRNA (guanosine(37)-N1)-methyltransferase TrmD [Bacteroidia bacterium]